MQVSPQTKDRLVGGAIGAIGVLVLGGIFGSRSVFAASLPSPRAQVQLGPVPHHQRKHKKHRHNERGHYGDHEEHGRG
jgi:hypothetical protein